MEVRFPMILDGSTGTQLQKRGFDGSVSAEEWVLAHPEVIHEIQSTYIKSGSHAVYAPTFGANRTKLESHGLFGKVDEFNKKLVAISKGGIDGKGWVAGDIAPTGKFLYPLGDTTFEELVEVYTEQAKALEEAGVDFFIIETMMTLPEMRAALLAVKSVSRKPVFVTATCDENGKTLTGTDVTAALVVLHGMGADAFGLNCSAGPDQMIRQLRRLKEYAHIPLIAKPNAGAPQLVDGKTVYHCPPEEFIAFVEEMAQCGVCIFGGCCGTEAEHIEALSKALSRITCKVVSPVISDKLPCATEKAVFLLDVSAGYSRVLPCDEELEDELADMDEDEGEMIAIRIQSEEELDNFADCQGMISKPLCILCEDAGILEQALRLYQGRAVYEGGLSDEALMPLVEKYGLIL